MSAIHLSQLLLDPASRAVVADVRDCHALHRRVMAAFGNAPDPSKARQYFGVLYRLEAGPGRTAMLLVQSNIVPSWSHLPAGYLLDKPQHKDVTARYATVREGMSLRFRIRANPTKKVDTKSIEGVRRHGRRVELTDHAEQLAWLRRKGSDAGFELVSAELGDAARVEPSPRIVGTNRGQRVTFAAVLFEGVLRVTDAAAFRETLAVGIGTGKAFGCGLLSIARN